MYQVDIDSPYMWTKTSQSFYEIIFKFIRKNSKILELGSSTGHISFRLAKDNYNISLIDVRSDAIEEARKNFADFNLNAGFFTDNFFNHTRKYDFIWNSGLIQCFDEAERQKLIKHSKILSPRLLLFYPDTDSSGKIRGNNKQQIAGVGDAKEYSVKNVPLLFYENYNKIFSGKIKGDVIDMPFDMLWIYGGI